MSKDDSESGWPYVGAGIFVFLFCMGIGGCCVLVDYEQAKGPLIQITNSK